MSNFLECTVGGLLDQMADRFPDNDALVSVERDLRYSYREFNEVCRRVAKGLISLGVKKGDHISIWANNVPEWVILQFATAKIGAVLVTINTSYRSAELEYILKQSDSNVLFMVQSFKGYRLRGDSLRCGPGSSGSTAAGFSRSEKLPFLDRVVFIGEETPGGMINFNKLYDMADTVDDDTLATDRGSTFSP